MWMLLTVILIFSSSSSSTTPYRYYITDQLPLSSSQSIIHWLWAATFSPSGVRLMGMGFVMYERGIQYELKRKNYVKYLWFYGCCSRWICCVCAVRYTAVECTLGVSLMTSFRVQLLSAGLSQKMEKAHFSLIERKFKINQTFQYMKELTRNVGRAERPRDWNKTKI